MSVQQIPGNRQRCHRGREAPGKGIWPDCSRPIPQLRPDCRAPFAIQVRRGAPHRPPALSKGLIPDVRVAAGDTHIDPHIIQIPPRGADQAAHRHGELGDLLRSGRRTWLARRAQQPGRTIPEIAENRRVSRPHVPASGGTIGHSGWRVSRLQIRRAASAPPAQAAW